MASVLSTPSDDFAKLWCKINEERVKGFIQSPDGAIHHICRMLDVHPKDTQVNLASQIRLDFTKRKIMRPKADAVRILTHLKSEGYRTGLVSNCSTETAILWGDTPFAPLIDVAVFSCSAGLMKPNAQIYQIVTEKLAVEPRRCLYIDDMGIFCVGATNVDIHSVLISAPDEDSVSAYPVNNDNAEAVDWDGTVISSLIEVLDLVGVKGGNR
jgi:putative hydrolase of the HAD superfamily